MAAVKVYDTGAHGARLFEEGGRDGEVFGAHADAVEKRDVFR